jgi:hypothetical protein
MIDENYSNLESIEDNQNEESIENQIDSSSSNKIKDDPDHPMHRASEIANAYFEKMNDGDRIIMKDLAHMIAASLGIPASKGLQLAVICANNNNTVKVLKGAYGGVFKGDRLKKTSAKPRCDHCGQVIINRKKKDDIASSIIEE